MLGASGALAALMGAYGLRLAFAQHVYKAQSLTADRALGAQTPTGRCRRTRAKRLPTSPADNHRRRHSGLGHQPPIARLNERTNLLGTDTY
jgi:hypothetical protein